MSGIVSTEYGPVDGIIIGKRKSSTWRKSSPVPVNCILVNAFLPEFSFVRISVNVHVLAVVVG
jgi:hypothetical protein